MQVRNGWRPHGRLLGQPATPSKDCRFFVQTMGSTSVFVVTEFNYRQAEGLIARYGFEHRLRSLDALQLAVALDLRGQAIGQTMVAADKTLCDVAVLQGLSVLNPKD